MERGFTAARFDPVEVRVAFLRSGYSYRSWARDNGLSLVTVWRAVRGQRGPTHDRIRRMLAADFPEIKPEVEGAA